MTHKVDFYHVFVEENMDPRSKYDFVIHLDFTYKRVKDIVVKGGEFVGFWTGEKWSLHIDDLIDIIDADIMRIANDIKDKNPGAKVKFGLMNHESSGYMLKFQNYCKKQSLSDVQFNKKIFFANDVVTREDYSTYQLPYSPTKGEMPAFDELIGTLYDAHELDKILWSLGALFTGDIAKIQKFLYLYGPKGTGKGTVLDIIRHLVGEYIAPIDLQVLTGPSEFATGVLQEAPMLLDPDSDISKIQKEMNLLKLTSHEEVIVRRLHKQGYPVVFTGLLVTASNERYKVKNVDSGITRRAIVVHPSGRIVPMHRYLELVKAVQFEVPYIAYRCIERYRELGIDYYQDNVDVDMMMWSDKVFDFVREHSLQMEKGITLKRATELYKSYLEDLDFSTTGAKQKMRTELPRFFEEFLKDTRDSEGNRVRDYFRGFKQDVAFPDKKERQVKPEEESLLYMEEPNVFDYEAKDWPAQYANEYGTPMAKWENVTTTLKDIDPTRLHYVRTPLNHIVIDFDIKNSDGSKDLDLNLKMASVYPKTYMETSKSGGGIHLHYYYDGDVGALASIIEPGIEVKVFNGMSSLRRKFIQSNDLPIAHISSGLPLKGNSKTMYKDVEHIAWTEKKLRRFVESCLRKEHHGYTTPEVSFIHDVLTNAKENGVKYDLSDMAKTVISFAMKSKNQQAKATEMAMSIPFKNMDDPIIDFFNENEIIPDEELYFYDIEVYPNLLLICWKKYGFELPDDYFIETNTGIVEINTKYGKDSEWYANNKNLFGIEFNPTPETIENMLRYPQIGFNNRKYDNHIVYSAMLGSDNMKLYRQSQQILSNQGGTLANAYNISYADLYEFLDIKMALKKWQIKLGIHHDEFEFPWDKPLEERWWPRSAQYCWNDVVSTEALFKSKYGQEAYTARKILCELTNMPVNTKTQTLAEKFLFGDDPRPQDKFNWYDLSKEFPGYKFEYGKSSYLGKDPSEGGYVSSKPGVYRDAWYIDVASLHPWSLINMNYFGPYTKKFQRLVECRVYIKHGEFEKAMHAFDDVDEGLSEKLKPYLSDISMAGGLGHAMKIIVNIVYGMTSAPYDNKFKDPRNIDNCVAKRGALFMMTLEQELEARGVEVIHVKTDSMKLVNASEEDVEYAFKRANDYGYNFELECVFDKVALVDKAQLIGLTKEVEFRGKKYEGGEWEGVGAKFNKKTNPYVYKTLFSQEDVEEHDFAILKEVRTAIYVGDRFIGKNAEIYASNSGSDVTTTRAINIAQSIHTRMKKPTEKFLPKSQYVGLDPETVFENKVQRTSKELNIEPGMVRGIVESGYPETIVENHYGVSGTKGYKWKLWNEYAGKNDIDMYYYNKLVEDTVNDMYKVGDASIFFEGTKWERQMQS